MQNGAEGLPTAFLSPTPLKELVFCLLVLLRFCFAVVLAIFKFNKFFFIQKSTWVPVDIYPVIWGRSIHGTGWILCEASALSFGIQLIDGQKILLSA